MIETIVFLILLIISIYSIKSYMKTLSQRWSLLHLRAIERQYPYCIKIHIKGQTCKNCGKCRENIFLQDESIFIEIDKTQQKAIVYSKNWLSYEESTEQIKKVGYHVSELKMNEF